MSFSEMVAMAPADLYKNSSLQSYFLCLLAQTKYIKRLTTMAFIKGMFIQLEIPVLQAPGLL